MSSAFIAVASAAASAGACAWSIGVWALRLEGRVIAHEKADAIVHENVDRNLLDLKTTAGAIDGKVDRLIEKFL